MQFLQHGKTTWYRVVPLLIKFDTVVLQKILDLSINQGTNICATATMIGIVKIEIAVCAAIRPDANSVSPPNFSANMPAIDAGGVAFPMTIERAATGGMGKRRTTKIDNRGKTTRRSNEETQKPMCRNNAAK